MAKRNTAMKITLISVGIVVLAGLTIWGAIWVSNIDNRRATAEFPKCTGKHAVHEVVIRNDKMEPEHTDAKRCDTLEITNLDNEQRIIAFGQHEHHTAYDGVTERYLSENGKFSVTLIQTGTFRFHDHEHDEVAGTFSVTQ